MSAPRGLIKLSRRLDLGLRAGKFCVIATTSRSKKRKRVARYLTVLSEVHRQTKWVNPSTDPKAFVQIFQLHKLALQISGNERVI